MMVFGFPCSHAKAVCTGLKAASAVTREKAELREKKDMRLVSG
jgi:hypothetical protein